MPILNCPQSLKYVEARLARLKMPNPTGSLSEKLPSTAIATANVKVVQALEERKASEAVTMHIHAHTAAQK